MELNKNAFPIRVSRKEVLEEIHETYKKKGYNTKFNKDQIYLTIVPYWFCFYDIYYKKDGKQNTISGQTALNAMTNQIEDQYTTLFEYSSPRKINKVNIERVEKTDVRIKKQVVNREESEKTIIKILSALHNVDKENVSLSGFVEIWIPFWKLKVENNKKIKMDAVSSKLNNLEIIEKRKKGDQEIFQEMLYDLQDPKKLLTYFLTIFKGIYYSFKIIIQYLIKNKTLSFILLLLIVIILILVI